MTHAWRTMILDGTGSPSAAYADERPTPDWTDGKDIEGWDDDIHEEEEDNSEEFLSPMWDLLSALVLGATVTATLLVLGASKIVSHIPGLGK